MISSRSLKETAINYIILAHESIEMKNGNSTHHLCLINSCSFVSTMVISVLQDILLLFLDAAPFDAATYIGRTKYIKHLN